MVSMPNCYATGQVSNSQDRAENACHYCRHEPACAEASARWNKGTDRMTFAIIMLTPLLIAGYVGLTIKIGFAVLDAANLRDWSRPLAVTIWCVMLTLPIAVYMEFFQ